MAGFRIRDICAAVCAALCLAFLIAATPAKPAYDAGVVQVTIGNASGSGVVIGPRMIVTAAHVAQLAYPAPREDNAPPLPIRITSKDIRGLNATVLLVNKDLDIAVLIVNADLPTPVRSLVCREPVPGEQITIVGYPSLFGYLPKGATITQGIVSTNIQKVKQEIFFVVDASVMGGNSGGPVFDRNGKVLGIAVAHFGTPIYTAKGLVFMGSVYSVVVPSSELCKLTLM